MNCNVTIDSQDLALGKEIASAIRGSNVNGLKGVQTMAFPHEGKIEIACNVESFEDQEVTETSEGSQYMAYSVLGDHFYYVSPHYIEAQVKKLASDRGIGTIGRALIGFTPQECKSCAEYAIKESIGEFWKIRGGVFMWSSLRFHWNCKKKISAIANFSYCLWRQGEDPRAWFQVWVGKLEGFSVQQQQQVFIDCNCFMIFLVIIETLWNLPLYQVHALGCTRSPPEWAGQKGHRYWIIFDYCELN